MGHPHDAMSEDISIDGDNDDDDAYAPLRNGSEPEDYDALSEDGKPLTYCDSRANTADRYGRRSLNRRKTGKTRC